MAARGACGYCRKSQLDSTCCRVGLLRRGTRLRRRADDEDHISALPDDLLLQILARLGCARAAANTSLLSRRWRGLWTRCPELTFHMITPDQVHAALGRIVRPAGSLRISIPGHHTLSPARISSLLAAAAPLAPAGLAVDIHTDRRGSSDADSVELPCFDRAASLRLHFAPRVRLPPAGEFTALESLSFGSCHMDLGVGALLPRCPCLRKLRLSSWRFDSVTVHSPSLQKLDVSAPMQLQRVDIMAPMLKKMKFRALVGINNAFSLSFSAPLVDDLSWWFQARSTSDRSGVKWRMLSLELKTPEHLELEHTQLTNRRENACLQPQHRFHGDILLLNIMSTDNLGEVAWTFEQEISQIPVRNLSVFELKIVTGGHVYRAMVLDLLRLCTSIQKLKVALNQYQARCSVNCHCDQPNNWKDQIIPLTRLKEVEIDGFKGEDHEVGLVKVLLISAAALERVTINLARNVPRSCSAYLELPSIVKAHPSVKFNICRWCGDQVLFE